jgi:hypothetical protein
VYAWLEVVFARPIFSKIKGVNIMELSTFFKKGIFRHFLALVLAVTGRDLVESIRCRFTAVGGIELDLPPRELMREPPDVGQ